MGKKAEQSRQTYNEMAQHYDTSREGVYTKAHMAEILRHITLHDDESVLDVACGTGRLLEEMGMLAVVHRFGVDLSENMIALAKQRCPDGNFQVHASSPLPFENESMHHITVSCAFHHFEKPQEFADACMRVLKENGTVYLAEPNFPFIIRHLANVFLYPLSHSGDVKIYSGRKLSAYFQKAGFMDIRVEQHNTVLFLTAKKEKAD